MKNFYRKGFVFLFVTICFILVHNKLHAQTDSIDANLFELSLEELMDINVTTASSTTEKLAEVPATMIVLTENDLMERGYNCLTDILKDLPGMDISHVGGDFGVANYWRGFRGSFNQPYLFMIDGMIHNEMYYNTNPVMDFVAISNIEKIEIVYGPVSSVYGANAFMGVINVITKKQTEKDGIVLRANTTGSFQGDFIGDYSAFLQKGKFRTAFATRFESYDLTNKVDLNDSYYASQKLYTDTLLWGNLAKTLFSNNEVSMPASICYIDYRIGYAGTEIGTQISSISNDWGFSTPADKLIVNVPTKRNFYSFWVKQEFKFSENFSSRTLLRYHLETRPYGSWIEANNITNTSNEPALIGGEIIPAGETVRVISFGYWPLKNDSWSLLQNFDYNISDKLQVTTGIRFELRQFSKQEGFYGAYFTPANVDIHHPDFIPPTPTDYLSPTNIFQWKDYSIYSQIKYTINNNNFINVGVRVDNNSEYGTYTTLRGGYILRVNKLIFKALYGQAYQIPTPRTLYAGWTQLGGSVDLKPEDSQTFEFNLNFTDRNFSSWISTYYVKNEGTIINIADGAKNLGDRNIVGIDAFMNMVLPFDFVKKMQIWAYYSTYLKAEEETFDDNGVKTGMLKIGDLSDHKIYFGATTYFTQNILLNLRARYVGERKTVITNPVGNIDAYFTVDANMMFKNVFAKGFDISFKVENLFDTEYFHPGINLANSGNTEGYWQGRAWIGSQGWATSVLPQNHRYFTISLMLNIDNVGNE